MRGKLAIIGILGLLIGGVSVGGVISAIAIGNLSTLQNRYNDLEQDYNDLEQDYNDLEQDYNNLTSDYNDLEQDYNNLTSNYYGLEQDYNNLTSDYDDLEQDYNNLTSDYNDLEQAYNTLFGDYQSVLTILEDPLTNPVIPNVSQVISWLGSDDTDTHDYVNDTWECGDFATMLMVRAKEMNWRMRIACMFFSFSGEPGYGTIDPYGSYGHAFNLIYCQDGSDPDSLLDLYYIEPQTDAIWYVDDGSGNHVHYEIYNFYSGNVPGTVWGSNTYWVNHYSYFA